MKSIGYVHQKDGFIRTGYTTDGECIESWTCDPFTIQHINSQGNPLKFKLTFKTSNGESVIIDHWSMENLCILSARGRNGMTMSALWQQLTIRGIRCCASAAATTAILNAFQKPELIIGEIE